MRRYWFQAPREQIPRGPSIDRCVRPIPPLTGLALVGLLMGCAPVPPAIMIASTALDGVSYLTTGKSGTDHILSTALDEDCALHRVISGVAICQPEKDRKSVQTASLGDPPVIGDDAASDDPAADDSAANDDGPTADQAAHPAPQAATKTAPAEAAHYDALQSAGLGADMFFVPHRLDNGPVVSSGSGDGSKNGTADNLVRSQAKSPEQASGSVSADAQPDAAESTGDVNSFSSSVPSPAPDTTAKAAPVTTTGKQFFVVLGSFAHKANADHAAHGVAGGAVRVVEVRISGQTFYRVVAGPFDRHGTIAARRRYADVGFGGAWPAPACEGTARPGCIAR